jgi:hypothetical protein
MRAPVTAERLEPFAEPGLCVAWLATSELGGLAEHRGEDRGLAQAEVPGRGQQRHRPVRGQGLDPVQAIARAGLGKLGRVPAAELLELVRVVPVPGPQLR